MRKEDCDLRQLSGFDPVGTAFLGMNMFWEDGSDPSNALFDGQVDRAPLRSDSVVGWKWTIRVVGLGCLLSFAGCGTIGRRVMDSHLVNARQLSLRGAEALDRNKMGDAEAYFSEALQNCPQDERAHWGVAQTLWERQSFDQAIHHMKEAIRLSSDNPEYLIRLGEMYLERNDIESARQMAKQAIASDHRNSKAWALMGSVHESSHQWEACLNCNHRALLIQPDYPSVQLAIADAYRQLGRPQRSIATLDRMIDLHPTENSTADSMLIRGLALADLGRNEEASEVLSRASDKLPVDNVDKQVEIATAYYRMGDLVQARLTLGKVLGPNPEHSDARRLQSTLDLSFQHLAQPMITGDVPIIR